ncbi:hypothetical protein MKW94_020207 [Papaver nudicaule]|uniref:TF-B3 domain-containing protein n=1 Tax=Papaver nudicaule TaxID=74823 RepID=A0AA41VWJ2_PAPNU|nr:hypothetical protein [Papaver nudicaule]
MGKYGENIGVSSSASRQRNHHFFKVFMPDDSTLHLKLPVAFINKLEQDLPGKVVLRDSIGKLWTVKVVKSGNDYFFQNGWENFVNRYSLQFGNFIVFNYHGNSVFHVSVFDGSECERDDTIVGSVTGDENPSLGEDACELEISESLSQSLSDSSENSSEKCLSDGSESSGSKGVKLEETNVIPNSYDDPEKAQFTATVNKRRPYVMHIPKQLVTDHGLELNCDMIIRVQSGKKWPVKVYEESGKRYVIRRGWHDFKTENKMKHGDKCILEFKKGRGGKTSNVINAYPWPVKPKRGK